MNHTKSGTELILAAHQQRTAPQLLPSAIHMLADSAAQVAQVIDMLRANQMVVAPSRNLLRPTMVRLNADGQHLPDKDDADPHHVATLLPQYGLIIDAQKPELAKSWNDAREKAKQVRICGSNADGLLEADEFGLIIRRDKHTPAADTKYFPRLRTDYIYWTNTEYASNSDYAWAVYLSNGYVDYSGRYHDGLVLACRRVPPSQ